MILTVTLNPSVDISYTIESLIVDNVNRTSNVSKTAGGKGLNVTRVIRQLGENVTASGFLGGKLGEFIREELKSQSILDSFVNIDGDTRNCIAILHEGKHTEVLEAGPEIDDFEADQFIEAFEKTIEQVEVITISGSLPKGLTSAFYKDLIDTAEKQGKPVLLDTNGKILREVLNHEVKPFLIKPNQDEVSDLIGEEIHDLSQFNHILKSDVFKGISWVVVTLGKEGAIVKHHDKIYKAVSPEIEALNPVGSGDSVIAGFAVGISKELSDEDLIKHGLCMGVLNAMEAKTGFIDPDKVEHYKNEIYIERLI